jgi:hypothetical protein
MFGTNVASGLVSVKYLPSGVATAVENGSFVLLGGLDTNQREVFAGATPAVNSALDEVVLIASEEVNKKVKFDTLDQFINEAGAVCRGYRLHKGDIFSITADAFTTAVTPTVGTSILELKADVKGVVVNTPTSGSTKVADLIAIEADGPVTWYVFQV